MNKYQKLAELIEMEDYEKAYNLIEQLSQNVITHKDMFFIRYIFLFKKDMVVK